MLSDRATAVFPLQFNYRGRKHALTAPAKHSTSAPLVTFNGTQDPGGKGKRKIEPFNECSPLAEENWWCWL